MIHQPFAIIDWVVLISYLVIVLLIGAIYRSGREGIFEYFLGQGRMQWWAVGLSLIATSVSASTFLGNPAEAFQFDLRLLQLNLCVPVSIIVVCAVFIPFYRRSGAMSAYEVLERRFDLKTRTLASSYYIAHVLLRTGILIFGPSIVVAKITGIDMRIIIIVVGAVTVAYTTLGGIRAVIWTDVLQFMILMAGGVLILVFTSIDIPGGADAIFKMAGSAGKLRWFDFSWNMADPRNFWAAGVAYVAIDLAIRATDQQFVQRYLSCVDVRRSQYAAILSAVLGFFVAILFFGVGIFLWAYYQTYSEAIAGVNDPNVVLPHYIATRLPWGVSGLIVAAVFAAAMSSIDSAINSLANTATNDFYLRFGGNREKALSFARTTSALWGALGILFALYASSFGMNIFELALSFTSLFTGALLGIFILAVAVPFASGWGAFLGSITGMATLAFVTKGLKLPVAWPWYPVISMGATIVAGIFISIIVPRRQPGALKERAGGDL